MKLFNIDLLPDIFVPNFEIKVAGELLPEDVAKSILRVSVEEVSNQASSFNFQLNDPKLAFIKKEDGLLAEGKSVQISIGYVDDIRTMMLGEISALTADFPNSGPATLQVQGFDLLHRSTRGTEYRPFEEGKLDSAIVTEIAQEMGFTEIVVDSTKTRTEQRFQNNISNLKFLEKLAAANGYFLWVEENKLYFMKTRPGLPVKLEWGKNLMSFSPRLSTAGQVDEIEVRGYDPSQKQSVSARSQSSSASTGALSSTGQQQVSQGAGGRSKRVVHCGTSVSSPEEAQTFADGMQAEQQRGLITGSGTSVGKTDIRVGTILDLSGIGRFNGKYVVERATHSVGGEGYQTSFDVRRHL